MTILIITVSVLAIAEVLVLPFVVREYTKELYEETEDEII